MRVTVGCDYSVFFAQLQYVFFFEMHFNFDAAATPFISMYGYATPSNGNYFDCLHYGCETDIRSRHVL